MLMLLESYEFSVKLFFILAMMVVKHIAFNYLKKWKRSHSPCVQFCLWSLSCACFMWLTLQYSFFSVFFWSMIVIHFYVWYCVFSVVIIYTHNPVGHMFFVWHCYSNLRLIFLAAALRTVILNVAHLRLGSWVSVPVYTDVSTGSYSEDFFF